MKLMMGQVSSRNDGFGVAGRRIQKALRDVGHEIVQTAPVNFNFGHPTNGTFTSGYDIMLMAWESTEPRPEWRHLMDAFDEIWVPTPWLQEVVGSWGYDPLVYQHGIDPIWENRLRKPESKLRFLHIGMEAYRKGGLEAVQAFRKAFGNRTDVELVLKTQSKSMNNFNVFPNVTAVTGDLPIEELIALYHSCHVMIAPSYGEGFGIPSRDALATGMPLVHTGGFAPYEKFMHPDLIIPSKYIRSPWPEVHPGQMLQPDSDALVDILRAVEKSYDRYAHLAAFKGRAVHKAYNWNDLTEDAFFALEQRLSYTSSRL